MSEPDLTKIARDAERDLNTYQAKTGSHKQGLDDTGVTDTSAKFPGSTVKAGDEDLVTSKSYNRRIPGDEGGDRDDKGHWLHGRAYEGHGGPEDKTAHIYQHNPGGIDEEIVKGWGKDPVELERVTLREDRPDLLPPEEALSGKHIEPIHRGEVSEQGRLAVKANLGLDEEDKRELPPKGSRRGSRYKASYYEKPESVPDEGSYMGEIPPESATEKVHNI
ncbi:hypothetical protein B0T21DRAFT_413561 [Apiosordaria backusii]|uniref:Uncharacterized protein n=1 Tax=Apiosordaria backusii TaxID=314023 RepID=A0AA40B213_9PEZI|nr:hypothetical protein B0T21DRAFT_413561 [Apiosordaria backusii]